MNIHVISLAHTQTTRTFEVCAFTSNVRGFCRMMKSLGHSVILYAGEDNDAPCDELVTCITKKAQSVLCRVNGPADVGNAAYNPNAPHWQTFNNSVIAALRERAKDGDFLCLISGNCLDPVAREFPNLIRVEFSCGYEGVLKYTHRVFPSYSWAQAIYTFENSGRAQGGQARFYDRVIPHYFDPTDFPFVEKKKPYLAFVGRLNDDKGYKIAIDVAREIGVKLVVAGMGDTLPLRGIDYRGLVGIKERAEIMGNAAAVFVPSLYMEPFGKVAVEALLCGTPIITTDFGALSEINEDGVTGYRCRTRQQFIEAAKECLVGRIHSRICRQHAMKKYSESVIKHQYEAYFEDLQELYQPGHKYLTVPERANMPENLTVAQPTQMVAIHGPTGGCGKPECPQCNASLSIIEQTIMAPDGRFMHKD